MTKKKKDPVLPHVLDRVIEAPLTFESPESSLVKAARYDPGHQELHVTLLQRTYIYTGVEPRIWEGFLRSESKGSYFNLHIRPVFKVRV